MSSANPPSPYISHFDPSKSELITQDLEGRPLTPEWFTEQLQAVGFLSAETYVRAFSVVESTVLIGSHSFSAVIQLEVEPERITPLTVFLKRVSVRDLPKRSLEKYRKDVASYIVESSFYSFIADFLTENSISLPLVLYSDSFIAEDENIEQSGFLYLFEDLSPHYVQRLDFFVSDIAPSLTWLAKFHSTFWIPSAASAIDPALRTVWARGTYWSLDKRPAEEIEAMGEVWETFVEKFLKALIISETDETKAEGFDLEISRFASSLLACDRIHQLGARLQKWVAKIDQSLKESFPQTLIHGDFKGAHFFFSKCQDEEPELPVIIDFQWCGVGSPMLDLVYFLHGVIPYEEISEREMDWVDFYLGQLRAFLDVPLDESVMREQYKLAFLDYARIVLAYFYRGCVPHDITSQEHNFSELTHTRLLKHVLHFVSRVDQVLLELENSM